MPDSCCAVGCSNWRSKDSDISFYKIPAGNDKKSLCRRQLWLHAIKRDKWTTSMIENAKLCNQHFISGKRTAFLQHLILSRTS